MFNCTYIYNF